MTSVFKHLFSPITIKNLTIKNRIVFPAHGTMFSIDPLEDPQGGQMADYLAARAGGGAGLIIATGLGGINMRYNSGLGKVETYWLLPGLDQTALEWVKPRHRLVIDKVHENGAKIFCQIQHGEGRMKLEGNKSSPGFIGISASQTADFHSGVTAHELEPEEMDHIAESTRAVAAMVREVGYDGLEFRCHGGYLFQQFLSPLSNRRTDDYGDSLENRMRFPLQCMEVCREAVGRDYIMGIRLTLDEFYKGGLTMEDGLEIVRRLGESDIIDYISVNAGITTMHLVLPDMTVPPGFLREVSGQVRAEVNRLPIIVVGRINDPVLAEEILEDGQADMIAMCRPLIADPHLPIKAREGRLDEIRSCVACNEGCSFHILKMLPITCIQNPTVGLEKTHGDIDLAKKKKRVLVVGGGVAGLKAAETAALRGHHVVLCEKEEVLGGQVALQARVASRQEYGEISDWLSRQVRRLAVDVRLDNEVTAKSVLDEEPDAVILATGSEAIRTGYTNLTPDLPGLPGADLPHVMTELGLLRGATFGQDVVVIEDCSGGDYKAALAAEYLADRGAEVTVITTDLNVGCTIPHCNANGMYQRLSERGVRVIPHKGVMAIEEGRLLTYDVHSETAGVLENMDNVVLVLGHRADKSLFRALKGKVDELYEIGDCLSPRTVKAAVFEGYMVGKAI